MASSTGLKVAITGANRGIGLALAKALHSRGDTIFGLCRKASEVYMSSVYRIFTVILLQYLIVFVFVLVCACTSWLLNNLITQEDIFYVYASVSTVQNTKHTLSFVLT